MIEILLVLALAIDAFSASIAYGAKKIKINFLTAFIIAAIGTLFLGLPMALAGHLGTFISQETCTILSFVILLIIGVSSFFQSTLKVLLQRSNNYRNFKFKFSNIGFAIDIYLDQTKADLDNSSSLSFKEALILGVALSVDSLATGIGSGFTAGSMVFLLLAVFVAQILAVLVGFRIGQKLAERFPFDLAWISGILIIILAFTRLS